MVHLTVFLRISPVPGINITPWNYGGYGYSNFPHSQIGIQFIHYTMVVLSALFDYKVYIVSHILDFCLNVSA